MVTRMFQTGSASTIIPLTARWTFEPWVKVEILTPQKYMGQVMELCQQSRGIYIDTEYFTTNTSFAVEYLVIVYEMPLMSLITTFFSNLKSLSSGYASLDYQMLNYRSADIVKVSILVNQEEIPTLSFLEVREYADRKSRRVIETLKGSIPKHQFKIAIQAAIGGKIIAREDISARRKDVTAKLYGGDITRKKKLLEKQKKGKKKTLKLIELGDVTLARQQLPKAYKALDKAAENGVLHPNASARKKSQLEKKLNSAAQNVKTAQKNS